jgi:glycogen debranching enzyme
MPEEIIQIEDDYYILATSSRADDGSRVIKHGDSFGVFDRAGAIRPGGLGEQGLYHDGTRFLNRFEITVHGRRLQPLRSTVRSDHVLVVDFTNPDYLDLVEPLPRDSIHVQLSCLLFDGAWYARIAARNFTLRPLELEAAVRFAADFADIFEIRGVKRARRGRLLQPALAPASVALSYEGLDAVVRTTRLSFTPPPRNLGESTASFALRIRPGGEQAFEVTATFATADAARRPDPVPFDVALARSAAGITAFGSVALEASNVRIDEWIARSICDLRMMTTQTPHGPYPYAGVPWFSTVFGRDGIITAFETLWLDPTLARGVLAHLAATQATEHDPIRDAEPGKIVHETRRGEMAALGEIPFGCYYGSVDATPLFVALAGAYWRRTADRAFVDELWPAIDRALGWIDHEGDRDGDGFVEYARRSAAGLASQGWKDSVDAVSHASGVLAEGPIALCEVQGYVYAARRAAALLARVRGDETRARHLEAQADELRERFSQAYWSEELGTFHLAIDGAKRPCAVRASNAGHALFAGIASPEQAARTTATLLSPHSFSGWGIRTLDDREARYNPMAYHNGSVWPHDNALIALGMARYGDKRAATQVLSALYRASTHFELHRLPELFCGFARVEHDGPTPYPVACAPQAWAAGAVFMLLQACLGLEVDAPMRRVRLLTPTLPDSLDRLAIRNLEVAGASCDLVVARQAGHISLQVERCSGDLEIVAVKR